MTEQNVFVPIFEKDGNKLFVASPDFVAETRDEAMNIGWGGSLVEGILLDMQFTNQVMEVDPKNIPHVAANIGNTPVAVISGPMFTLQTEV